MTNKLALVALTRRVSDRIAHCALTHVERTPIDLALARAQHQEYERCLVDAGCAVQQLSPAPELPDSVFVEDTRIVLNELAIIARLGLAERREETVSMAPALQPYRPLHFMPAPCTLDGGDVLVIGKHVFVGQSGRTNAAAVDYLRTLLTPFEYAVTPVSLNGCLHLKSAATLVATDTLLINSTWVERTLFGAVQIIDIDPTEPFAANALWVNDKVIHPAAYPKTRQLLIACGINVITVDVSELAKAEGGVTCCSVIFRER